MRWTRRQVILGLLGVGACSLWPIGRRPRARPLGAAGAEPVLFEPDRRRALAAAVERVFPGALEAGGMEYIEGWMRREPFATHLRPVFRVAAVHLDRLAREAHGRAFADCAPEQQDALLGRFQRGEVPAKGFRSAAFFEHLVRFTLESFLCDPKHGGNRDQVGWRFIGHRSCWWAPRRLERMGPPRSGPRY